MGLIGVVVISVLVVVGKQASSAYCSVNQGLQKGASCPGATQLTNFVSNPKLDNDATGYWANCFGTGCSVISSGRITSDAPPGATASWDAVFNPGTSPNQQLYFGTPATGIPVTAGQTISMSAMVKVAAGPAGTRAWLFVDYSGDTANPACGSGYYGNGPELTAATLGGGWQWLEQNLTIPAGITCVYVDLGSNDTGSNVDLRMSELSTVVSAKVVPYFDGDSQSGAWLGAKGSSQSTAWVSLI